MRRLAFVVACSAALIGCSDDPTSPQQSDRAPVIAAPGTAAGPERTEIAFDISVTDPDGDAIATLTADLSKLPAGHTASFNKTMDLTSGRFTWTPSFFDSGAYDVTFAATNTLRSNRATTRVVVQGAVDHPPIVTAPASLSGTTGETIGWAVTIDDQDGDFITDIRFDGAVDTGGGSSSNQSHVVTGMGWQACEPGTYTAVVWAFSGNPAQSDTAWTEITVTGTAADHYVDIVSSALQHFDPDTLVIQDGETVAWRNLTTAPHDVFFYTSGGEGIPWIKIGCESKPIMPRAFINPPLPRAFIYVCSGGGYHPQSGTSVIIVNP